MPLMAQVMNTRDPERMIPTAHLFRPLGGELVQLLRTLSDEAWLRPTSADAWRVRDVAAHLLDVDLRRLSSSRDGHLPPAPSGPLDVPGALVSYLNELNADWVRVANRISPRVLVEHLELACAAVADHMETLDPWAEATFPVAWAGEDSSPMWLDMGRELTERWHHQDQIREAVGAASLEGEEWLLPVLEISLFALPFSYRNVAAAPGTRLRLRVTGAVRSEWLLSRTGQGWQVERGAADEVHCTVTVDALQFARLLMHRLTPAAAERALHVDGDAGLAAPLLRTRAVMV